MFARRGLRWAAVLGAFTLLGLFFATQTFVAYGYSGKAIAWPQALALGLAEWYAWAAVTPIILWLAGRFPLDRRRRALAAFVHLAAGFAIAALKVMLDVWMVQAITGARPRPFSVLKLHTNVLTYGAIAGAGYAAEYYRRYRERELRASQLEGRLAQARLELLKMQLHPHFLFNTLHAISTLMHRDVEAADRMISLLGDLLRLTLENSAVQEVPLKQELEFLEGYLEIERTRFEDRLTIERRIEPETLDALMPSLFLQPLVENAIRHGIAARADGGRVEIRAALQRGREDSPAGAAAMLLLEVRDDGPGLPDEGGAAAARSASPGHPPEDAEGGVGLANTRARLEQLYGSAHQFRLSNAPGGGLVATLQIPYRTIPDRGIPDRTRGEGPAANVAEAR